MCPNPTWDKVILALETTDENRIAQQIRKLHTCSDESNTGSIASTKVCTFEYMVDEETVLELLDLRESFSTLSFECERAFEAQVTSGNVKLKDVIARTKGENEIYNFENLNTVKSIDDFFDVIRPHYQFLDCNLLTVLVKVW